MWRVYLLQCSDGSLYAGIARDVRKRLATHRSGRGSRYVRSRLPVRLVYQESCRTRSRALKREAEIKGWTRRRKLALLAAAVRL